MLNDIKKISENAQRTLITNMMDYDENSQEYLELKNLHLAYAKLTLLIDTAEKQRATAGLLILSRQLHKNSTELNAVKLMENFLNVLDYSEKTTFSMHQQPHLMGRLNAAKLFAMLPLLFMTVLISALLPALLVSPMPWLYLAISALPLLAVYAYDEPFSMSRWYQEMAGIEKVLAWSNLGMAAILIIAFPALFQAIPLLALSMVYTGMLATGYGLLKHSEHLQAKHEALSAETTEIDHQLYSQKPALNQFFKPESAVSSARDASNAYETLKGITAGC
jgi:hypothetical protein